MKFKGFWSSFWELQKHSCEWLKDYWFAYMILFISCMAVCFIPYAIEYYKLQKEPTKKEVDDLMTELGIR